ncbi:MAG TPA: flagellar FliJ family protein [Stellaceae bacterium]|jgi:flagellar protein FliJ|nr:flagellar FliJ family protein [Stellaceae bacterium]
MSSLDTLIKLHRWQLDEQRRKVAEFENLAGKLRAELQRLDGEEQFEQRVAGASHEASYAYSGYAKAVIDRRGKLTRSIDDTEQQIVEARAALADAYAEVKRYEIAAANRLLAKHRGIERLRQQELDEVALDRFRRRDK